MPRYVKRIGFVVICILVFYGLLMLFGRESSDETNPIFDPHHNPNIRVE